MTKLLHRGMVALRATIKPAGSPQASSVLLESHLISAAMFNTLPECIKVVARDGRLLTMNPAGLAMIEADSWDLVRDAQTADLIAPEHCDQWLENHVRVCHGESLEWEFDIISLKGTRRHMETHATPLSLADGTTAQLAVTRDITASKTADAELQRLNSELEEKVSQRTGALEAALARLTESERGFSLLVESVTDYAIYMLDPEGYIVSWNAGARRIKGYEASEIVGLHFQRFYSEEDRAANKPMSGLKTAAVEGRLETEGWRLRKDGSRFWANVIIDAIHSDGKLVGFAKITRDITEKRASEEKLRQAQKMEAVGQFTGGVAHDFNNLLMAVLGSLEILRKRLPDDPKLLGLLDNAVQGAKRGASLTQRMLAFARRQELKQETVELSGLVREVNELMERSLSAGLHLELRLPRDPVHVLTDSTQLQTALLNLVINARDAMPSGGAITVGVRKEVIATNHSSGMSAGAYASLWVTDTGTGMDAQTMARATEPFFTTKGVGKGTGLGLSMVDGLAAQSGGKLIIHSKPRVGTTMEIWLPLVQAGRESTQPIAIRTEAPFASKLTILAVDDDRLVLSNVVVLLEDLGHQVIATSSALEAIDVFADNPDIDVVISDQVMPVVTGLHLIEMLRAKRPYLPAILATGFAEFPDGVDASIGRLAKPYTQQQLKTALEMTMSGVVRQQPG
jgi:PAS domain S-box-containing protein